MSAPGPAHGLRSPAKRPQLAAHQQPPPPPPPLPLHLQHAVHQALTDLQAQRLLYPQQCAAAEAEATSARQEAQQRVTAGLGPFSYSSVLTDLDAGRQAAKQLARRRLQLRSPQEGGALAGGSVDPLLPEPPLPEPAAQPAAANKEEALWAGYEGFSAAVSAEVDRRIASARLLPPAPAAARGERLRHLQQRPLPAALHSGPTEPSITRQPLGSLQQQEARLPPTAAAKPAGAQRKRERSPQAPQPLPPAAPGGGRKALRQQAGGRQGAAAQAGASPSSKRPKPHVAFGSRCDAPRPVPRSSRPVKLEAACAPTPPQLPAVLPEGPSVPPAHKHLDTAETGVAAAAGRPGPGARSDLLRSLTAALAGSKGSTDAAAPVPPPHRAAAAREPDAAGSAGLQRMLADLTVALQSTVPPAEAQAQEADSSAEHRGLPAVLLQHGIDASVLQDTGSLLQAVLDRMEGMEERATAWGGGGAPAAACVASAAAAAGAGGQGLIQQASPASAPNSPSAQQLCDQFSRLLQASGTGLQEVQQQLACVRHAEAAAQRMEAAAAQAALAGLEAAAQAAEQSAAHRLETVAQPPAAQPCCKSEASMAAAERNCCDRATRPVAPAPAAAEEQRCNEAPAVHPIAESAAEASSPQTSAPAADAVDATPLPTVPVGEAEQSSVQQVAEQPPVELPLAPPAGTTAAGRAPASLTAADAHSNHAHPDSAVEPAEGWPVQWQPPVAPGIPLLLPPDAVQPQWYVPAAGGCTWQPAGALMPAAVPLLAPQLGTGLCWGQPAVDSPEQQQEDAAVQWDQPFSVASDEELPDSPSSSACASSATSPSRIADGEAGEPQAAAEQGEQEQAERQQALLDQLAVLSIRQYQQHVHLAEDLGCDQLAAADGAWDAAAAGVDGSSLSPEVPAGEEQELAPEPVPTSAAGSDAVATAHSASAFPAPPLPSAGPAAWPTLPQPPAPYQPLKAAAEAAAAARQREEAAGWHRLWQRADELVLWHEYAAELGISMEGPQQQQPDHRPPPVPLPQPGAAWAAGQPAVGSSSGAQVHPPSHPSPQQQRLWRPLDVRLPHLPEALAAPSPVALASPTLASSYDAASSCPDGSGTSASSCCLASEESSSLLSSATSSSSLGVGARHKARALRYRLLRRRLEQATGLRASRLPVESSAPSESDCLSPATDASLATPLACKLPGSGGEQPRLRRLHEQPATLVQAAAGQLAASMGAAGKDGLPAPAAAAVAAMPMPSEGSLLTVADGEHEAVPEGSPSTTAAGGGSDEADNSDAAHSPPLDSHLADHLSSATPSECPTLGSRVPGGAGDEAGEAAAGGSEAGRSGRSWRRVSDSSCSTLREVSEAGY